MKRHNIYIVIFVVMTIILTACSSVSNLEPGEVLYTGLKKIDYTDFDGSDYETDTKAEVEAALAMAPNGALFGSSYYRTPFGYGLWVWNAYHDSDKPLSKWICKSFGKQPVLMQNVNVPLRTSVAKNVLANNGYFHGTVTHDILEGKPQTTKKDSTLKPRTAKVQYHVSFGKPFTLDSIGYSNFPDEAMRYIDNTRSASLLHREDPFNVATLDKERTRIYNLFRNKGFYYYQKEYVSYLADTLQAPGKVQLQMHLADSLDEDVMRRWVIGSTTLNIRRTMFEELTDSLHHKYLYINFGKPKPPVRGRVLLQQLKMRPGSIFSQQDYQESLNNLLSQGIFSSVDISFQKRYDPDGKVHLVPDSVKSLKGESRAGAGILDMTVNTVLDKPYSVSFGIDAIGKTNDRLGPGLALTLTKKNAFRGGELFSITAGANYEFQYGNSKAENSYDISLSTSLMFPRLLSPLHSKTRHRWYTTPSTTITLSAERQRRAGFFTRTVFSGEYTYIWQPSACSVHKFTPLSITYGKTTDTTADYDEKISESYYSLVGNLPEFTPRMRYTYTYTSPSKYRNPIYLQATVQEAGNLTNLGFMLAGRQWNNQDKEILGIQFSQFLKFEADFRKTWAVGTSSNFVLHFYGGYLRPLGNDPNGPFAEWLYIGGANDLRGFAMRSVGPGNIHVDDTKLQFMMHNGDLKLVFNAEYRPKLFGSLYGALFLDAGNVWYINHYMRSQYKDMGLDTSQKDVAIDVGVGLRYDLDYFVLRLDWGFAIHKPYHESFSSTKGWHSTGDGFFNVGTFKEMQCINLAIGYPF